jgi:acetoin utilization deacetylase AcuC-like enzyme
LITVFSSRYHIDIGTHIFPTTKYVRVFDRLRADPSLQFVEPDAATWEDLALVHTPEYLTKLQTGAFTAAELAQLEVPWSREVVEGFRLMTGGTVAAAQRAIERDAGAIVAHIGGGLHHAFPGHGEGFCLFNDVAVAIRVLLRDARIARATVIDLDVHHGNGTAFIFEADPRVFTFSMHQQHNYPMVKPRGSLDVGLKDGATDEEYLERLSEALPRVFAHAPDVVFYLAGADPYEHDQLGGLALTKRGLQERDRLVLDACGAHGVPAVVLLAGGYAHDVADTVAIHAATIEAAAAALAQASPLHER